jgi:LPXTG-site transpeptidase (sortase) family protein
MQLSAWPERLLIVIGCGCLLVVGTSLVRAASFQKTAAQTFDRLVASAPLELSDEGSASAMPVGHGLIGRLEIPRLNVSVIVMDDDEDATVARAPETAALPWERGTAVIARHRDTFFRPPKNISEGDEIRMTTTRGTFDYRVIRTEIVEPDDLSVLAPAPISLVGAATFQQTAAQTFERELVAPAPPELSDEGAASVMPAFHGLIGRLEIPRLNVSVIVMEGDDVGTLARAVGHLPETAVPWERGNTVIAGHRDTFFRPLRHVREGDEIRMTTARGTFDYRVIRTEIVEPDDLSVLAPTPVRSLTLVTCYPFVYVGSAPQRFIIHARSQH